MNNTNVSIATITWARDEGEENLLRESLEKLAKLPITVFITDGGSRPDFLDFLRGFPNFVLVENKGRGLWPQAKNSLLEAYASGVEFIFYTEPDKRDFFHNTLPGIMEQFERDEKSGIMIMTRSVKSFATFPSFQRMTETTINNCCAEIIGNPLDYTYGPFIMNRKLIPHLERLKDDIGWGWRPYSFCVAHRLGFSIRAFEGDFYCPVDQQQDDPTERIYRMRQLNQNIEGIVLSTSVSLEPATDRV